MSTDEQVEYINTRAWEIMIEQGIVTDSRKLTNKTINYRQRQRMGGNSFKS